MAADATLVIVFGLLARLNSWAGVIDAAVYKYGVFMLAVKFIPVLPSSWHKLSRFPNCLQPWQEGL